ncbi:MAG TPA: hypothetical protein VF585_01510 [Chthoniobacterales bacterium]|jgi:hypothetical protein
MKKEPNKRQAAGASSPMDIYNLLEAIREKPGMYLTSRTLSALKDFISGYYCDPERRSTESTEEPPFSDLGAWICQVHPATHRGGSWFHHCLDAAESDSEAFDYYHHLLKTYRSRQREFSKSLDLTSVQIAHHSITNPGHELRRICVTRYRGENFVFLHCFPAAYGGWYLHTVLPSYEEAHDYVSEVFGDPGLPPNWALQPIL